VIATSTAANVMSDRMQLLMLARFLNGPLLW